MLLSFLTAIAIGGVVNHCAAEVADDYADELNGINMSMQKMQDETNKKFNFSKENFQEKSGKLISQKKNIFETTLTNFAEVFGKIKNVEFNKNRTFNCNIVQIKKSLIKYNDNSTYRSELWNTPTTSVVFSLVGSNFMVVESFVSSMRTMYKIDEAKAEFAQLRSECETVKTECVKIDSLSTYCKRAYSTISTLQKITDRGIKQLNNIILESGTDFSKYSKDEKENIRTIVNFATSINKIIITEIFDKNGNINLQFKKYVDGV